MPWLFLGHPRYRLFPFLFHDSSLVRPHKGIFQASHNTSQSEQSRRRSRLQCVRGAKDTAMHLPRDEDLMVQRTTGSFTRGAHFQRLRKWSSSTAAL
uniref:Uncharacterized protein n=1 Tax=Anopheles albimanus TaxID=7167 RepID=A0A182FXW2_ANOAL